MDWEENENGESSAYKYWEWGMGQLGAIDEKDAVQSPGVSPDFDVHDL